ncbi:hypothetical protein E5288_WYG000480 [Bos mutus]|uniref:Uncharacterized protein n=1 Tax=Bos mutus TaxID=72004 RepID=A0A6B0QQT0_9CETA|nr:hypothetical protein [Bos mutus]
MVRLDSWLQNAQRSFLILCPCALHHKPPIEPPNQLKTLKPSDKGQGLCVTRQKSYGGVVLLALAHPLLRWGLIKESVGRGVVGCDSVVPGTQGPVMSTISPGFSVPSMQYPYAVSSRSAKEDEKKVSGWVYIVEGQERDGIKLISNTTYLKKMFSDCVAIIDVPYYLSVCLKHWEPYRVFEMSGYK